MGQTPDKPCRLCGLQRPLRNSHIFPKFYWDWLKETGSGYFRKTDSPNVKRQDGRKVPLLCHDCEQLFSVWESDTARKVFAPLMGNSARRVEYPCALPGAEPRKGALRGKAPLGWVAEDRQGLKRGKGVLPINAAPC
jgi:hypothetical protein